LAPIGITNLLELRRFLLTRFKAMPGEKEGVLHVASVWRPPGADRNVTLRLGDRTPESEVDFLLLNVARARADAIVTTGRILREESSVVHDLQGDPGTSAALADWRRRQLALPEPPWLLVLTSGRALDSEHPAFHAWARPLVFCPQSSASQLADEVDGTPIEVVGQPRADLRAAVAYLRSQRHARRITIEAGPSTARELYRDPPLLDELLLSVFEAPSIPDSIVGGELPPTREIERILGPARAAFTVEERSGRWRFEHYGCAMVGPEGPSA
jgi:riboflavin biosynthesis pyrimidine reductase